jgi:hypothetical protein
MTTGFTASGGSDLSALLAPRGSLTAIGNTGFKDSSGTDLANVYAGASFGTAYSTVANTGFVSGGVDIATLFAKAGSLFTPVTTQFTTAGAHTITIPNFATSMTLEIEGGGGGGGGDTGIVVGNGGSSGGRTVSTYSITSANWGQTLTLTCGAAIASTGVNNNDGQTGNASSVVTVSFPGFTTMTANGGGSGTASLGGAGAGGSSTGGNVTNQNGNTNTAQQTGAAGLTGTFINGLAGATGAGISGGTPKADTATTIGQGAVHFS